MVEDIKLLLGIIIGVIVCGDEVIIVNGNFVIKQGDYVVMFIIYKKFVFDVEWLF